MIYNERDERKAHILNIARQMMTSARTAPKGKGIDIIETAVITDETITALADFLRKDSEELGLKFFLRDADNIEQAGAVVLIGTKVGPQNLNCGYCGVPTCEQMLQNPEASCAINQVDLGIAIGSAVATASDQRVDTRVMFSAGYSAKRMGLLKGCHSIYAIPLSISSKNPFFDRK